MTFTPDSYGRLLDRLLAEYDLIVPASPPWPVEGALLRHDVDLIPQACHALAAQEEERGLRSCWFFRVDGHYNVLSPQTRDVLQRLAYTGHAIGLHYDCETPGNLDDAFDVLRRVAPDAEAITGHRPTLAGADPHRLDPRNPGSVVGHGYVADSRRTPLRLPDPLPRVLQVNTHPEHYATDLPLAEHYAALADELAVSLAA